MASAAEVKNHVMNQEEADRLQALEDRQWAMAAGEAEKSGYIGQEQSLKTLTDDTQASVPWQ